MHSEGKTANAIKSIMKYKKSAKKLTSCIYSHKRFPMENHTFDTILCQSKKSINVILTSS